MAISFPENLDDFTNPVSTDTLDSPSHSDQHSDLNDAVEALETKVGIDSSADTDSLDYKVENMVDTVIGTIYPVGAIYTSTLSTNPATLFGFGTWEAYGEGRVLVGKAGSGTFSTAGATGGAETHTLTTAQIPTHLHTINHTHSETPSGNLTTTDVTAGTGIVARTNNDTTITADSGNTGGGESHNILQPYVVVYIFRRTS
jgi:hypothetical protein